MPKKSLSAISDRAVRDRVTKWRAGLRWGSVVEKVWKNIGGNQEEILSIVRFAGYKTEAGEMIEIREKLALRNKLKGEEHFEIYGE